jgi:hypothetical protein
LKIKSAYRSEIFPLRMQNFLAAREISGLQFSSTNTDMVQKLIPKLSSTVDTFQSKAYAAQFSTDGNYCWVSTQDHEVHFYDSQFNRRFQVQATVGQWSITDCQLSSNNKFLAYSSITPFIHLAKISEQADESTAQECLDLSRSHSQFGVIKSKNRFGRLNSWTMAQKLWLVLVHIL